GSGDITWIFSENRRDVEVGFNVAKAGAEIAANVPTRPVIYGRGCGQRCLHRHISRKCRCSYKSSDGDNADCQLVHKKPPRSGRIYTMRPGCDGVAVTAQ